MIFKIFQYFYMKYIKFEIIQIIDFYFNLYLFKISDVAHAFPVQ